MRHRWMLAGLVFLLLTEMLAADVAGGDPDAAAWAALVRGGHVAVIRHGNAPPGRGGDPPGFKLEDCATQRNLDEAGREQARALGEAFRRHGVRVDRVVSSPWCRCVDTARLMAVGAVETSWALVPDAGGVLLEPPLGPDVTGRRTRSERPVPVRFRMLKELVSTWRGPGTLVLVTHAFTVGPLAGLLPEQAETVVLEPSADSPRGGTVVGRIPPPDAGR